MLRLRGTHVKTRSHLLCSPAQGLLCSSIILNWNILVESLGRSHMDPMGWYRKSASLCSGMLAHRTSWGVKLISIFVRLLWGWWLPGEWRQGLTLTKYINFGVAVTIWCQHASSWLKDTILASTDNWSGICSTHLLVCGLICSLVMVSGSMTKTRESVLMADSQNGWFKAIGTALLLPETSDDAEKNLWRLSAG